MLGGPLPIGIGAFVGVKFAGYSLAAYALKRQYQESRGSVLGIGAARTAVGIVAGVAYAFLLGRFLADFAPPLFYVGLIPVRLAEWAFIIWAFFERPNVQRKRLIKYSALGSAWSFLLDIPAIVAVFTIPGGFWIC